MPAPAINANPGDPNANSYATLAEARAYYSTNYYATNSNLDDDDKLTQLLETATRLLDEHFDWFGSAVSQAQALLWPRYNVRDAEGLQLLVHDDSDVPEERDSRVCAQLLDSDRTADDDVESKGISSLTAGPISLTFTGTPPKVIPDSVMDMVTRYGVPRGRSRHGALVRA
jgi:hypothetical protein